MDRYLAYTQVGDEHGAEITGLYGRVPEIASLVELEENATESGLNLDRARRWLDDNGLGGYEPARRSDGTWQLVLPAKAFGRTSEKKGVPLTKLGSFLLLGSDLIHLWCTDEKLRHDVLLRRMDDYLAHRSRVDAGDVEVRLARLIRQLALPPIDPPALRSMAGNAGLSGLSAQLARIS